MTATNSMKTLLAAMSAMALTACGTDVAQTSGLAADPAAETTSVEPGTFKTYTTPKKTPSPACDVHTKAELVNGLAGGLINLEDAVDGTCEIYVEARPRTFNLREVAAEETACGTKVYTGDTTDLTKIHDPRRVLKVEVIDHRGRVCRDVVDAQLIVKETHADGRVITRYSRY